MPAPAQQVATLGVTAGTSPGTVTVGPQLRAWFELSFPNTCNQILLPGAVPGSAAGACYAGTTLQVIPPRSQSALLVYEPLRFTYGATGFQVGPFQSGSPPPSPPVPQ